MRKVRLLLWTGLVWIWWRYRRVWLLCMLVFKRCRSIWGSLQGIVYQESSYFGETDNKNGKTLQGNYNVTGNISF